MNKIKLLSLMRADLPVFSRGFYTSCTRPFSQSWPSLNKTTSTNESNNNAFSSPKSVETSDQKKNDRAQNISRAMAYYLEKLAEKESIMKFKSEEFEIGRRHLARMMGENPDNFTQQDIDKAIEYLLPSGLFAKRARPFLKHPQDYYPKSKTAAFGSDGRPLQSQFYTGNSELYQLFYELTEKLLNLNRLEDSMNLIRTRMKSGNRDERNDKTSKLDLAGSVWINYSDLCKKFDLKMDEFQYKKLLTLVQKLADHSLSKREEPFIKKFLVPFVPPIKLSEIPANLTDEHGKAYQEVEASQRTAIVKVRLTEGTGQIKIRAPEGEFNINFFESLTHREQLLFPFKVIDSINKYDLDIKVNHGGMSCLAKAIRYATSRALCSFVSAEKIEKLRMAGLLSFDARHKERKKPGQEGARRRYTWKKR